MSLYDSSFCPLFFGVNPIICSHNQ